MAFLKDHQELWKHFFKHPTINFGIGASQAQTGIKYARQAHYSHKLWPVDAVNKMLNEIYASRKTSNGKIKIKLKIFPKINFVGNSQNILSTPRIIVRSIQKYKIIFRIHLKSLFHPQVRNNCENRLYYIIRSRLKFI